MATTTPTTTELNDWYDRIEAHARAHYNEDGWDFFVETMDRNEFADRMADPILVKEVTTYEQAFEEFHWWCRRMSERRADVRSTIW